MSEAAVFTQDKKRFSLAELQRENRKKSEKNAEKYYLQLHAETTEFEYLLSQVKSFVSTARGETEEERREYNRILNLAVLGHHKEKELMYAIIKDYMAKKKLDHIKVPVTMNYHNIYEAVFANVIGLKVLEEIMTSSLWEEIEEIQVVDTDVFYVKRGSRMPQKYLSKFPKINDVKTLQDNLVLYNEESINEQKPYAEVITPTQLRIAMTRPPLTQEYSITIRQDIESTYSFKRLIELETINEDIAVLLAAILHGRLTTFITGDTGVGKTNLLLTLIAEMNSNERFITIESDWELNVRKKFPGRNVIQFQTLDNLNLLPKHFFKIGLRMTPMRIILPEVRGEEAGEFIRAVTRGHQGSITTGHITTVEDIPAALSSMAKQGDSNIDEIALINRIARFVLDIAIQLEFIGDERRVTRIAEVHLNSKNEVSIIDLYKWDRLSNKWLNLNPLSFELAEKIRINAPLQFDYLKNMELLEDAN